MAETYFADYIEPERPFSVFGHVVLSIPYAAKEVESGDFVSECLYENPEQTDRRRADYRPG